MSDEGQGATMSEAILHRPVVKLAVAAVAVLVIAAAWNRIACRALSRCP